MSKPSEAKEGDVIDIFQDNNGTWIGEDLTLPRSKGKVTFFNHSDSPCVVKFLDHGHFEHETVSLDEDSDKPESVKVRAKTRFSIEDVRGSTLYTSRDYTIDMP